MPNPIVIRADGVFSIRKIACQKEARDRIRFEKKPRRPLPPIAGAAAAFALYRSCVPISRAMASNWRNRPRRTRSVSPNV